MRKRLILTTVFLGCLFLEISSAQILPFRSYSIELGLSESVAHDIIQDERGYIWVGTGYGLNRFDGKIFKQFYEEDGLANNRVHSLFQGSDSQIWIGTDRGISLLRGDSLYTPDHVEKLSQFVILSIFEDKNGSFWFGTDGQGFWKLDTNHQLRHISEDHQIAVQSVRGIDQAEDGTLWFATREGVVRLNHGEFYHYCDHDGLPEMRSRDVKVDNQNRVWIGSRGGLFLFENGSFEVFNTNHGLNDNRIQTISIAENGDIWVGTESGVSLFRDEVFTNYTREEGLPATIIYSSMIDNENNLWFGTLGGGITIFSGETFLSYNIENGLPNNVVTGFMEDRDNNIWIATYGGGALRYDGSDFELFNERIGLVDNKVYAFYQTSDGAIWIGAREGVSIYQNGIMTTLDQEEFPFTVVRSFFEDEETGDFWIATYNDGVFRLTDDGFEQFYTGNVLQNNTVMHITKDQNGDLWFATYGGAVRYDGEEFHHITIADNLPSNGVIHIYVDHNNEIWFSTFNGPAIYRNGEVVRIIRSDRVDTIFYFTLQDTQGRYWFGTNQGLYHFRKDRFESHTNELERMLSYRLYSKKQGLIANELNAGGSLLASDGSMWLGTVEGLSRFFPERISINRAPPGLEIEEAMMSGKSILSSESMRFLHDQNFLQVMFSGLTYEAPDQIIYEYRLSGHNEEWQLTRENIINYPALSPGDYILEIRAYNADGTQSIKTAGFAFTILPPFYFQAWFILLVVFFITGLVIFYIRYFNVTKQVDIEKMRVQIASDLHDDVGSSLTELALQTDFLQTGTLDPQVRETLKQIGEQSRKIVSSLDDIVWSIDSRNDTAGDLTDRMQDYVNQIFVNGNIEVIYNFGQLKMDQKLPVDIKENLYLIFKESVNNIAKHSDADKVDIFMLFDGRDYELKVSDNGTKRDKNKKTGQGLRNIKMRADRISADIQIDADEGYTVHAKGSVLN